VLTADGVVSLIGCLMGNPFINAVYIGHPGWKAMGGRIGYSAATGIMVILLSWLGIISVLLALVPVVAISPILLYIGMLIGAQAFQTTPIKHAPAIVLALTPHLAAWAKLQIDTMLGATLNAGMLVRAGATHPKMVSALGVNVRLLFSLGSASAPCWLVRRRNGRAGVHRGAEHERQRADPRFRVDRHRRHRLDPRRLSGRAAGRAAGYDGTGVVARSAAAGTQPLRSTPDRGGAWHRCWSISQWRRSCSSVRWGCFRCGKREAPAVAMYRAAAVGRGFRSAVSVRRSC